MERYRVYINKQIEGPFEIRELLALEGFNENSLVCLVGEDSWLPAARFRSLRYQFAVKAGKIGAAIPSAPATDRSITSYQDGSGWRVSESGDFMGPDFQLNPRRTHPKPRLSSTRSRTTAVTTIPVAQHIPLPQPRLGPRKFTIFMVWMLLGGGLWAMGAHAGLPKLMKAWWDTHPLSVIFPVQEMVPRPHTVRHSPTHPRPKAGSPAPQVKTVTPPSQPTAPKQKNKKPWFSDQHPPKSQRSR